MRKILLPTDFSETSFKAGEFACRLFGTGMVEYTLVHAYLKPAFSHVLLPSMGDPAKTAGNGLRRMERRYRKLFGTMHLAKKASFGQLHSILNEIVEEQGADFIVMGTQGEGNFGRIGRNTTAVVTGAALPVIAVPSQWEQEPVKRILLADDGSELTAWTLAPLLAIAKISGAQVAVVHVRAANSGEAIRRKALVATLLQDVPHTWEEVAGDRVVEVINDQARLKRTQLVAVIRREKSLLDRILHGSTTKQLALHTSEPLLVLREQP